MDVASPTLDQLRIFLAVVEEGSFNAASRRMGRAISAISYGVANLEAQLGVILFDRQGSRRPVLTEAGMALVSHARTVADDVSTLLAKVKSLKQGLESELSLAVDVMVPGKELAQLLRDFQWTYPTVPLRLHVEGLGAVAALLLEEKASLAIAGPDIIDHPLLEGEHAGAVQLVPVAAPSHPLATSAEIKGSELRKQLQLVLTDRSDLTQGKDFAVFSPHSWRLADLGSKHELLKEGIGWGYMPLHLVERDIETKRLVRLPLPQRSSSTYALSALWRKDTPPGPAAAWILDQAKSRFGTA